MVIDFLPLYTLVLRIPVLIAALPSLTLAFAKSAEFKQGHTAKRYPSFKLIPIETSPTWLLDSGASHHVTSDLSNLSLHAPYNGSDDIMIGDGTGLLITHTGSISLHSFNAHFSLTNVLCVPSMKKKLITISKFCIPTMLPAFFSCKRSSHRSNAFDG